MTDQPVPVDGNTVSHILAGRLVDAEMRAAMWETRALAAETRLAQQHNETELRETALSASEGAGA